MINHFRLHIQIGVHSVSIVLWNLVDVPSRRSFGVCSTTSWSTSTARTASLLAVCSVLTNRARMQDMKCSHYLKQQISLRFVHHINFIKQLGSMLSLILLLVVVLLLIPKLQQQQQQLLLLPTTITTTTKLLHARAMKNSNLQTLAPLNIIFQVGDITCPHVYAVQFSQEHFICGQ